MDTTPPETGSRPDRPPEPPGDRPPQDHIWYYRLNLLAAATLAILVFCLVWRPAAWIGLGTAVISLGSLFFYHYFTRAQMGLVEFILMIAVLGQVIGITLSVLWPQLRDTSVDWMILAVWIMESAWILCGALWASWVARTMKLSRLRDRLRNMLVGWLAPPALVGLCAGVFFTVFGLPGWLLQTFHGETENVYPWQVVFAPFVAFACVWLIRTAMACHAEARMTERIEQEHEEKIVLPRELTQNLRERTTPEDLPLDEADRNPDEKAPPVAPPDDAEE
jgi:hypothetical protein